MPAQAYLEWGLVLEPRAHLLRLPFTPLFLALQVKWLLEVWPLARVTLRSLFSHCCLP